MQPLWATLADGYGVDLTERPRDFYPRLGCLQNRSPSCRITRLYPYRRLYLLRLRHPHRHHPAVHRPSRLLLLRD